MRIRKRKVPLPFSLLSPIPLSDPHLFNTHSPVHLHHPPQPPDHFTLTSTPSDLHPLILLANNTNPTSSGVKQEEDKDEQRSCLEFQGGGGGGGERIAQKSNNDNDDGASKEEVEVAVAVEAVNNNGPVGVSLSSEGVGRWSEGERVIPLKKRRASESFFEKHVCNNCEEKTVVANSSTNSEHNSNNKKGSGGGSTKQKRGTTIMEGSRCSRVNGRGWRCCQPTLVGYSLCEHHLGKGRLRSMTSVRGRPSSKKQQQQQHMVKDNHDKEKHQAINNKRVNYKLGVVKARSLSSLLGQTTSMPTITSSSTTSSNSGNNVGHDLSSMSMSNRESDAHVVALSTN